MNQTTSDKISRFKDRLWKIHNNRDSYKFIIPMLDEPYQLALKILEFDFDEDLHEVVKSTGINWQTVKQVRKALS